MNVRRIVPPAPARAPALALVVLALALAPTLALAAETSPVLVERTDAGELVADVDANATATFSLFNLNPIDDFYVSVVVDAPPGWSALVAPNRFFLPPRNTTTVEVSFHPDVEPKDEARFPVDFSLVHGRTGDVTRLTEEVVVASAAPPRVLGLLPNPLAAPLDNALGTFLLDLAAWVALAVVAVLIGDAIVRTLTTRASSVVTREIATKLRRPLFLLVALFGLGQSLEILPANPAVEFVRRVAIAIAVGVFGLFVLYKMLDAALFYYQQVIAPRTATKIDDVLIPVARKMGIVVLYVVGIIYTLRLLGWDPTIIFAGAGIAGLVIAFAAQDTFSNLFSGLFLMLDRPFVEGDVIVLETGEVARVESIGLRTTELYEFDHHHVITVPNNQLATRRIINYSAPDTLFRVDIFVAVAYGSEPAKVERILREVARDEPEIVQPEPWAPIVQLREFAESSLTFMLRVTLKDPRDKSRVPSKVRTVLLKRFAEEGIEIPFPQRVVHMRTDEAQRAEGKRPRA